MKHIIIIAIILCNLNIFSQIDSLNQVKDDIKFLSSKVREQKEHSYLLERQIFELGEKINQPLVNKNDYKLYLVGIHLRNYSRITNWGYSFIVVGSVLSVIGVSIGNFGNDELIFSGITMSGIGVLMTILANGQIGKAGKILIGNKPKKRRNLSNIGIFKSR